MCICKDLDKHIQELESFKSSLWEGMSHYERDTAEGYNSGIDDAIDYLKSVCAASTKEETNEDTNKTN